MPKLVTRYNSKIFNIENDFASLRSIGRHGDSDVYRYEFNFDVDQISAMRDGILTASIAIYLDRPQPTKSLFLQDKSRSIMLGTNKKLKGGKNSAKTAAYKKHKAAKKPAKQKPAAKLKKTRKAKPYQLIKNLQVRSSLRKDVRRRRRISAVLRTTVDMTAFFSNTLAPRFATAGRSASLAKLKSRKGFVLQSVGQIKSSNIRHPILKIQNRVPSHSTSRRSRRTAVGLVLNHGVDPATVYRSRSKVQTSMQAISGLTTSRVTRIKAPHAMVKSMMIVDKISTSTVSHRPRLSNDSLIPVFKRFTDPNVNIRKNILINEKILDGKSRFYVKFDMKNISGRTVFSSVKTVQHSRQLIALATPRIAPDILLSPYRRFGKNVLEVRQRDPVAETIHLYRKTINRSSGRLADSAYLKVGVLNLSRQEGDKKFIDLVDNSKTYIYRAIPIGSGGEIGIKFGSVVSRGLPIKNAKRRRTISTISITTELTQQGIEVKLTEFPIGPVSVKVMRRDMTLHERDFTVINDASPIRLIGSTDDAMFFLSTDVKEDHIYEFAAVLIYEDGDEEYASQVSLIQYDAVKTNVVETSVSTIDIRETAGNKFNATFNIKTTIVPGKVDIIKRALEDQDLLSEFADVLKDEREDLQKLVTHTISRTDMTNGETVDLGLFVSGKFNDRKAGRLKGAPPLSPGRSYRYTISPQLRSAETLFSKLKVTKKDATTGRNYTYKPSKFKNPFIIKKGTLKSAGKSSRITAKNDFELGAVGSPFYFVITVPKDDPDVNGLRAYQIDRDTVEITWSVSGDMSRIDHFIVQALKLDGTEFIGAAHNISDMKSFRFYDELDEGDQEIQYRVIMVSSDYRRSRIFKSNKVEV